MHHDAPSPSRRDFIRVWDPFVRIFHWSLVASFTVAYFSGEEESAWHIFSGYAVIGLVLSRIAWGLVGTRHARFSDFLYGPAEIARYARGFFRGRPDHYTGHNPLGGLMVIALLIGLLATTITGLMVYAIEEHAGPLASFAIVEDSHLSDRGVRGGSEGDADEAREEFWEELHELFTNLTLGLVFFHIIAVLAGSAVHRENLIKAMITGRKPGRPAP